MITNAVEIGCCRQEVAVETVTVEFFGVPRHRAGRAELVVAPGTIAEAFGVISRSCPGLADLVQGGKLAPHYALSLNGQRFLRDLDYLLAPGDRLLLLSADAGG
jgi:molybdopterin converting factor small subunit